MLLMAPSDLHAITTVLIEQVLVQQAPKTIRLRAHSLLQVLHTLGHDQTTHNNQHISTQLSPYDSLILGDLHLATSLRKRTYITPCLHISQQSRNRNPDHFSLSMAPTHQWILHLHSEPVLFHHLLPAALCVPTQTFCGLQTTGCHLLVQTKRQPRRA